MRQRLRAHFAPDDRKARRTPRALADTCAAFVLQPRQHFGDARAGESSTLCRREVVADDPLQLADRTAEHIELPFDQCG
jgi:hypothetical protein